MILGSRPRRIGQVCLTLGGVLLSGCLVGPLDADRGDRPKGDGAGGTTPGSGANTGTGGDPEGIGGGGPGTGATLGSGGALESGGTTAGGGVSPTGGSGGKSAGGGIGASGGSGSGGGSGSSSGGGSGGSGGGSGGSGGATSCEPIDCALLDFPRPSEDVCFEFVTGQFGGFQVSNGRSCQITFDETPMTPDNFGTVNQGNIGSGTHTLVFEDCSSPLVSWSCWP